MSLSDLGSQTAVVHSLNMSSAPKSAEELLLRMEAAVEALVKLAARPVEPGALTLAQAAQRLSVSARTLGRMAKAGEVRTVTLGRRVLVPTSEIVRLLEPAEAPPRALASAKRREAPSGAAEAASLRAALRRRAR
jgi:excisionase family DNA binding protein